MSFQQLKNLPTAAKIALALAPTTIALVVAYIQHLETQKLRAEVAASKERHESELETNAVEKLAGMKKRLRAAEEKEKVAEEKSKQEEAKKAILQQQLAAQHLQIKDLERKHEEAQKQLSAEQQRSTDLEKICDLSSTSADDHSDSTPQPSSSSSHSSSRTIKPCHSPQSSQSSVISALKAHINARELTHNQTTDALTLQLKKTLAFANDARALLRNQALEALEGCYGTWAYNQQAFETLQEEVRQWRVKGRAAREKHGQKWTEREMPEWRDVRLPVYLASRSSEGVVREEVAARETWERVVREGRRSTVMRVVGKYTLGYGEFDV